MKRVLLVTPYNLTRNEVGGAFTYQFSDKIADSCKLDVILYQYKDDIVDKPEKSNIEVICAKRISKIDKYVSWFQCPFYHPLFTSRYSRKMIHFICDMIEKNKYDYLVFDYSQTFAMAKAIDHPNKLLVTHDVIYQRYERRKSKLLSWIKWSECRLLMGAERIYAFSEKDSQLIKSLYGVECFVTPVFIKEIIIKTEPTDSLDYYVFFADWRRDENVLPLSPQSSIKVIGGGASDHLREQMEQFDKVEYLGFVDNPYPIIANAKNLICPLHSGAGIKVKCLEALACGTPVIGTEVAFEGIDDTFREFLFLANTPDEYLKFINTPSQTLEGKRRIKEKFLREYNHNSIVDWINANNKIQQE